MTTPDTDPGAAETTRLIDETDYEVGQNNIQTLIGPFGLDIHNPVFLIAGLGVAAFVLGTLMVPDAATALFQSVRDWLTTNFLWFFILGGNVFVLFGLLLIVTPLGSERLGGAARLRLCGLVRDAVRSRHGHRRLRAAVAFLDLLRRGCGQSRELGAAVRRRG